MLIVKRNESGPRIIALQILLNRRFGKILVTDGIYGQNTSDAVARFRNEVMKTSGSGDLADGPLWLELIRNAGLQAADAVDVTDPVVLDAVVPELGQFGRPIQTGAMTNGVIQVMTDIKAQVAEKSKLLLMRFHGHGGPGLASLTFGKRSLDLVKGIDHEATLTVLNGKTVATLAPALRQMAQLMADFGFVEFHACRVALGAAGAALLRNLADIWNVPVTASTESQSAEGKANFLLTGQLVTAFPGGVDLRRWAFSRAEKVERV
ncbi:MAG: DUF4347 domain-containing protein [Alphaproteobacteria bacterium]|nr:DUF4347 domain-containing protein [Alphaproteobacteria bacterium]